jgi:hypothetical protein
MYVMQSRSEGAPSGLHKVDPLEGVNAEFRVGQDNTITRNIHAIKVKKEAARVR